MENKNEVIMERIFDASRELIWRVWTNAEMLKQWWGPNDVSIPECEVDLKIPGRFYIVMEAGEGMGQYKGTKWPMEARFTFIEPNSKLSYVAKAWTEGAKEETMIDQTAELTLVEESGKTKLTIKAVVNKMGPKAGMAVQGMQYGFAQQLDKLNNFLMLL